MILINVQVCLSGVVEQCSKFMALRGGSELITYVGNVIFLASTQLPNDGDQVLEQSSFD